MLARMDFPLWPTALRGELDRALENVFDSFTRGLFNPEGAFPALNVWQDGEKYYVEAEVPGMKLEELEILVRGAELTIKGRRTAHADNKAVYHRQERWVGEFTRFLTLPAEIDADRIDAKLKDGVLTVMLPKSEVAKTRKITVKSA